MVLFDNLAFDTNLSRGTYLVGAGTFNRILRTDSFRRAARPGKLSPT